MNYKLTPSEQFLCDALRRMAVELEYWQGVAAFYKDYDQILGCDWWDDFRRAEYKAHRLTTDQKRQLRALGTM